jgi:uncharacterized protein (TIGR02145 family)
MKKINSLVLSTLTAAFLVGCGGGGGGSSTPATSTDVTVERGAIWGAAVTDANGQVATQQSATSNVYTFASAPKYPIKALGGIIDIDGNPETTDDVIDFTGKELTSYSNVITPITHYLGDTSPGQDGEAKLEALKTLLKITSSDDLLKKVPSDTNNIEILALTNALFQILNDDDGTNDDSFEERFTVLKTSFVDGTELKDFAKLLEEEVVNILGLEKLTEEQVANKIEEIKGSLFTLTQAMISGKEILTQSGTDTLISQFKEDGSYIEIFNGYKEDCTGTWKLNETSKGTVDIVRVCNNVEGSYQLIFTEEPKDGSKFKVKNTHSEELITIDTIRDISNDSSSSNPEFKNGDTFKGLTYNIVTSSITGKKWLDRNLGATEVCSDSNSTACYGDYYQWGRLADGHEKVDSTVNSTKSISITNAGSSFIIDSDNTDWTSTDSDKTLRTAQWNKTDGTGICPAGFRVPTIAEFDAEIGTNAETKMDNFRNTLKFSESSGFRNSLSSGELVVGSNVWSIDLFEDKTGANAFMYSYDSQNPLHNWNGYNLTDGIPVRCIEGK